MQNVMVRFETGQEDRISQEYGPFPFVQLTYNWLRVGPDGDDLAFFDFEEGDWLPNAEPAVKYSDVVIYPQENYA
jgi:hypothetical protein